MTLRSDTELERHQLPQESEAVAWTADETVAPSSHDKTYGYPCRNATTATARFVETAGTWTSCELVPELFFESSGWFAGPAVPITGGNFVEDFTMRTATRFNFRVITSVSAGGTGDKYVSLSDD